MARYIDADNLVSVLEILCDKGGDIRYWEQLKWIVADCPTADVVKVVRCKDCKQYEWYIKAHYKNGVEVESHECRKYKMAVAPDWFCADGERNDDERI